MKTVFFGNTKYSLIGARIVHEKIGLSFLVTIPNSPVHKFAESESLPFLTTTKLNNEAISRISEVKADFFIVEDYGLILPDKLLSMPKYSSTNVHHSLLPKYRGPSPAPSAILEGDKVSGVTIIKMSDKVDAGDIYDQKEYVLGPDETTDSLLTVLNEMGGELVVKVIKDIVAGIARPIPQNERGATYSKLLNKRDGFIEIDKPPEKEKLDRMIRAYFPWPGVWFRTIVNGKSSIVKLLPGNMVQVEGKNPQSHKDFINGYEEGASLLKKLQLL